MKWYPRAHQQRPAVTKHVRMQRRKAFFKAASVNFLLLQLLFLALFCYVFGSIFSQNDRASHIKVLYVDYDGGDVGSSVRNAYNDLKGKNFPTIEEHSAVEYPTVHDLRHAVCRIHYWGAIFTSSGASDRLQGALAGGTAAASYNRSEAIAFVWNEARYPTISDQYVQTPLKSLSEKARIRWASSEEAGPVQTLNTTDSAAFSVLAAPWDLQSINIQPTSQGARLIYNTLVIILILIQEFFYLGTINALYGQFKIYTSNINPHRIIFVRLLISATYCFAGSLCTVGAIWAYRSGWHVNGSQFMISWMVLWLFAHVNFLTLDVFTIWLPPPYVPMALITWVMFNVASILVPFELSNPFYQWAYIMPSHEVYQILIDIWSGGCNPQLQHALPVLFALELSGLVFSAIGVHRRAHYAALAEEAAEEAMKARVNTALAIERDRIEADNEKRVEKERDEAADSTQEAHEEAEVLSQEDRAEIEEAVRREESILSRQQSRASRSVDFGPSFSLAFGSSNRND